MENALLYTQQTGFQEFPTPASQEWASGDESDKARARRLLWEQYYSTSDYAHSPYESITVWTTKEPSYVMVAWLDLGSSFEEIWFPTKADFIHYWHQFAATRIAQLSHVVHDMHEMTEKLFQAQHGHAGHEICRECDPMTFRRRAAR